MGEVLNSEKEIEKFLKTYNPAFDPRLVLRNEKDKAYIFYPGDYVNFNKKFCYYQGFVKDKSELNPNIYCLYRIGARLYYKKPVETPLDLKKIKPLKKKKEDLSPFLDVTVKEYDNELMVIAKEELKGMRQNTFRSLFPNSSDYNNVKRELEKGGQMSFNRWILLQDLLGFDHEIIVKMRPDSIMNINNEKNKMKVEHDVVETQDEEYDINNINRKIINIDKSVQNNGLIIEEPEFDCEQKKKIDLSTIAFFNMFNSDTSYDSEYCPIQNLIYPKFKEVK